MSECVRASSSFNSLMPRQVASITKVMTFLVAHDGITSGAVGLLDPVPVQASVGGTSADLQVHRSCIRRVVMPAIQEPSASAGCVLSRLYHSPLDFVATGRRPLDTARPAVRYDAA